MLRKCGSSIRSQLAKLWSWLILYWQRHFCSSCYPATLPETHPTLGAIIPVETLSWKLTTYCLLQDWISKLKPPWVRLLPYLSHQLHGKVLFLHHIFQMIFMSRINQKGKQKNVNSSETGSRKFLKISFRFFFLCGCRQQRVWTISFRRQRQMFIKAMFNPHPSIPFPKIRRQKLSKQ